MVWDWPAFGWIVVGGWFCLLTGAAFGCKVELVREVPGLLPVCSPLEGRFFPFLFRLEGTWSRAVRSGGPGIAVFAAALEGCC